MTADSAYRENEARVAGVGRERRLDYWREYYERDFPLLQLPTDNPRTADQRREPRHKPLQLSAEITHRLELLGVQKNTHTRHLLLAALGVLLRRYTQQSEISIGFPILQTDTQCSGSEHFLDHCYPLYLELGEELTFSEWMARLKEHIEELERHCLMPFGPLLEALDIRQGKGSIAKYQVLLAVADKRAGDSESSCFHWADIDVDPLKECELAILLAREGDGLKGLVVYQAPLFLETTVDRFIAHFECLLKGIVANPDQRLSKLPMLPEAERRQLLEEWCGQANAYPRDLSIPALFTQQAWMTPQAVAVEDGHTRLTYAALDAAANRLARWFRQQGVAAGDRVALCVDRSVTAVTALLAVLKAGAAYVPLDPDQPPARLQLILEDTKPALVLANESYLGHLPEATSGLVCLEDELVGLDVSSEPLNDVPSATDLAYVMYTSGSTGKPKGVCIPHRGIVRLVKNTNYAILGPEETHLLFAPLAFDASTFEIWGALLNGGRLVAAPPGLLALEELGRLIQETGVTTLWLTAGLFHQAVEQGLERFTGLRQLLAGGDVLSPAHVRRALEALPGVTLINGYGPTESTTFTCCHPMRTPAEVDSPVPIGRPIANTQVFILDADLEPVPVGVPGELYIGGDGLAQGYLNDPGLTAVKFIASRFPHLSGERLYRTGDRVRFRSDGTIEFLGRLDNQLKLRGFRIELGEIETVLRDHPAVAETAVVVTELQSGDRRLAAHAVLREPSAISAHDLRQYLRERLPEYMIPTSVALLDALPLTANGKIDRHALMAVANRIDPSEASVVDGSAFRKQIPYTPPQTETETALVELWQSVLSITRIGIHDDFFELGGHSLLAIRLVSHIRDKLGVAVPLKRVFECPTIEALAKYVQTQLADRGIGDQTSNSIPRKAVNKPAPLSFAQEALYFLDKRSPGLLAYNESFVYALRGTVVAEELGHSLESVIRRHEILRTHFAEREGGPCQVVDPPPANPLRVVDLNDLSQEQREREALARGRELARQPFDLCRGPLIRATLYRLEEDRYWFVLIVHHIVFDGWSPAILLDELAVFYNARLEGKRPELPELPVQFSDYADWQRAQAESGALEPDLAYWRERMAGYISKPVFWGSAFHPEGADPEGGFESIGLDRQETENLRSFCLARKTTSFAVLMAAWQTLLFRYSGNEDMVVGIAAAIKSHPELEPLIGYFVNTLPLRGKVAGHIRFASFVEQVHRDIIEALEHRDLPLATIVQEVRGSVAGEQMPLVQSMFAGQDLPSFEGAFSGFEAKPFLLHNGEAKFPVSLMNTAFSEGIRLDLEYDKAILDELSARRLLGHFKGLLTDALAHPDRPLGRLAMLDEAERRQVLEAWCGQEIPYPRDASVPALFARQVRATPDALAVQDARTQLSYGALEVAANRLARRLRQRGVDPGDRIALCVERGVGAVTAILAVLKAGAAYVPLDPDQPPARLQLILEDTKPELVLASESYLGRLATTPPVLVCLERELTGLEDLSAEPLNDGPQATDLAYIMYTSGSTGAPKGVCIEHRGIVRLVKNTTYVELGPAHTHLLFAPLAFDASTFELWGPLLNGGRLVVAPPGLLSLEELGRLVERSGVDTLWLTAGLFHQAVEHGLERFQGVRQLLAGGDVLSPGHVRRCLEALPGVTLINGYGPTESTTFTCCHPMRAPAQVDSPVPIGRPIGNTRVFILDEHLEPTPMGVPGELYIGGDGLARGYLNDPELTAARFIASPFPHLSGARLCKTGDRARFRPDGTVEFLGRLDAQVKLRGFRIELGEIEETLLQHPAVSQAAVVLRDEGGGEKRLVAYVVLRQPEAAGPRALSAFLRDRLPAYMIPATFVPLETLPLNTNGKVDRARLPVASPDDRPVGTPLEPPRNDLEAQLVELWEELLDRRPIGIHDDFFELGGHSLIAIQLVYRLESFFGISLPLRKLFEYPTIASLAEAIEEILLEQVEQMEE